MSGIQVVPSALASGLSQQKVFRCLLLLAAYRNTTDSEHVLEFKHDSNNV